MGRQKPKLVRVHVVDPNTGERHARTINVEDIRATRTRHHVKLTRSQQERADKLYDFAKLTNPELTTPQWRETFLYDIDIETELFIWEHMRLVAESAVPRLGLAPKVAAQIVLAISVQLVDIASQTGQPDEMVEAVRNLWRELAPKYPDEAD